MNIQLEKREIKYAIYGAAMILLWFLYVRPIIATSLQTVPPVIATILFQVGLLAGLLFLSTFLNGHQFHIRFSLITFMVVLGIGILTPPYLVTQTGSIHKEVDLWYLSADAAFADMWGHYVPASMIWNFTYIVTPILLMIVIPVLLTDSGTIKKILQS